MELTGDWFILLSIFELFNIICFNFVLIMGVNMMNLDNWWMTYHELLSVKISPLSFWTVQPNLFKFCAHNGCSYAA